MVIWVLVALVILIELVKPCAQPVPGVVMDQSAPLVTLVIFVPLELDTVPHRSGQEFMIVNARLAITASPVSHRVRPILVRLVLSARQFPLHQLLVMLAIIVPLVLAIIQPTLVPLAIIASLVNHRVRLILAQLVLIAQLVPVRHYSAQPVSIVPPVLATIPLTLVLLVTIVPPVLVPLLYNAPLVTIVHRQLVRLISAQLLKAQLLAQPPLVLVRLIPVVMAPVITVIWRRLPIVPLIVRLYVRLMALKLFVTRLRLN